MLALVWCCGDTDAQVASDGTYRECWFCSHFYAGLLSGVRFTANARACGFLTLWCPKASAGEVSKLAKALKITPELEGFEFASLLER